MQRLYGQLHEGSAEEQQVTYRTPARSVISLPARRGEQKFLGLMPSVQFNRKQGNTQYFGSKCLSIFLGTSEGVSTHQGVYILFEGLHGQLIGILDAAQLTSLRTAASSAVAAQALLPATLKKDPSAQRRPLGVGLVGTGEQARQHAVALYKVFATSGTPVARLSVWGRNPARAQACVQDLQAFGLSGVRCEVVASMADLVAESDILCTLTSSETPLVRAAHFAARRSPRPLLILAVGACTSKSQELDPAVVIGAQKPFVVDTLDGALREAGDLLAPAVCHHLKTAQTSLERCTLPLSRVLAEGYPGENHSEAQSILFKSVGFGAQDLALSILAYETSRTD